MTTGERPGSVELDSAGLKAIAHPLRARLLAALRSDGPATATELAARFDTNSGQTSYHLRVLADAGLVEEDGSLGTARQRYWRPRHRVTHVDARAFRDDPASEERLRWLESSLGAFHERLFQRWLEEAHTYPPAWREAVERLRLAADADTRRAPGADG